MIERYLSIIEISQKQAYIFGSNKLKDNINRSAEIWWLTKPEKIDALIGDKSVFDWTQNTVYAGGGHTVLSFGSYEKAYAFGQRYTFLVHTMNPEIELFLFTLPYCSRINPDSMLEHVCRKTDTVNIHALSFGEAVRSQEDDEKFVRDEISRVGEGKIDDCAPGHYLDALVKGLERKKSLRCSSFHQGSFGIEKIDSNTRSVRIASYRQENENEETGKIFFYDRSSWNGRECSKADQEKEAAAYNEKKKDGRIDGNGVVKQKKETNPVPDGFEPVYEFEDLGGTKGENNFIAVVHIDGNGMGARCSRFYKDCNVKYVKAMKEGSLKEQDGWKQFRDDVDTFSKSIDEDFKKALKQTFIHVQESIFDGRLENISLKTDKGKKYFPIRGIIASGDDICFVTEGRIGIECAAIFLEELAKLTNAADLLPYSASAGVAIVHQKYPFFRAYELAERLCDNAKAFAADVRGKQKEQAGSRSELTIEEGNASDEKESILDDNGAGICAIDWHLEMGEIGKSLEEIRDVYLVKKTEDNKPAHLEMRPYIVAVTNDLEKPDDVGTLEPHRQFNAFRKQMEFYLEKAGSDEDVYSKLKDLRLILRKGETETEYFINSHKLKGLVIDNYYGIFKEIQLSADHDPSPIYVLTCDGTRRSVIFDAAEALEVYSGI